MLLLQNDDEIKSLALVNDQKLNYNKSEMLDRFSIDIIHAEKVVKDSDSIIMNKKLINFDIHQTFSLFNFKFKKK
jgi:hypothetical protein